MTGVEVLSENNIYVMDYCWWVIPVVASIVFLVVLILAVVNWINFGFDGWWIPLIISVTTLGAVLGVGIVALTEHETDTIDYIEYKVTIDDSVSMTEFMDKYEILDQEGKIYTVREKE